MPVCGHVDTLSDDEESPALEPSAGAKQAETEKPKESKAKAKSLIPKMKPKAKDKPGVEVVEPSEASVAEPKKKKQKKEVVMKRPSALRRPAAAAEPDNAARASPAEPSPSDLSNPFWYKSSNTWACKFKSTGKQPFSAGGKFVTKEKSLEIIQEGIKAFNNGKSKGDVKSMMAEMSRAATTEYLESRKPFERVPEAEGVDSSAGGAAPSAAAPEEPSAAAEDASNAAGDHAGSEAEGAEEEDLDDDKTLEGPGVDVD